MQSDDENFDEAVESHTPERKTEDPEDRYSLRRTPARSQSDKIREAKMDQQNLFETLLTKRPAEATFNPNAAGFIYGNMSSSSNETAEPTSIMKNYTSKEKADRLQEMKSEEDKVEREFPNELFDVCGAEENVEEVEAFDKKKAYLETLREFQLIGEHKTDLDAIKLHIETWKTFGRVPASRRHIEGKFNKILDALFEKLSSSKKDNEMVRYANRLDNLSGAENSRKLDNEKVFIMRKIEEVQSSLFQLENNIQFFGRAKADNPMVKEVLDNIEKQKEELATWKEKLKQLKSIKSE
mgnify:CR=1 FL=1